MNAQSEILIGFKFEYPNPVLLLVRLVPVWHNMHMYCAVYCAIRVAAIVFTNNFVGYIHYFGRSVHTDGMVLNSPYAVISACASPIVCRYCHAMCV